MGHLDTNIVELVAKATMGHQNVSATLDMLPDSLAEDEMVAVDLLALAASIITDLTIVARKCNDKREIEVTTWTQIQDDPDLA